VISPLLLRSITTGQTVFPEVTIVFGGSAFTASLLFDLLGLAFSALSPKPKKSFPRHDKRQWLESRLAELASLMVSLGIEENSQPTTVNVSVLLSPNGGLDIPIFGFSLRVPYSPVLRDLPPHLRELPRQKQSWALRSLQFQIRLRQSCWITQPPLLRKAAGQCAEARPWGMLRSMLRPSLTMEPVHRIILSHTIVVTTGDYLEMCQEACAVEADALVQTHQLQVLELRDW